MANPDQKTILIDNAFEEIKNICINLQKDTDISNFEVKSLLKLTINEWEEKEEQKLVLDSSKVNHFLGSDLASNHFNMKGLFTLII